MGFSQVEDLALSQEGKLQTHITDGQTDVCREICHCVLSVYGFPAWLNARSSTWSIIAVVRSVSTWSTINGACLLNYSGNGFQCLKIPVFIGSSLSKRFVPYFLFSRKDLIVKAKNHH